jgi:predicted DNA-binding transcriptional regulator YafY
MVYYRDNWYLVAFCHLRGELRSFGLDAIQSAVVTDIAIQEVDQEKIEAVMKSGYGIFGGAATSIAKLQFSSFMAQWVKNETWHKDQVSTQNEDGSLTLEIPYSNATELVQDIMKYGSQVKVIAPVSLQQQVVAELTKTLETYKA